MKKTAIVSGAAGFIGSHLVDLLLKEGFSVIGIDNLRTGKMENLTTSMTNTKFEFVKSDIRSENLLRVVNRPVDIVYILF